MCIQVMGAPWGPKKTEILRRKLVCKRDPLPFCAAAVALAVNLSTICFAQSASTTFWTTVTYVRADMLTEWLDLQKNEVVPALKRPA